MALEITKQAAAYRLIHAAIHMHENSEDVLATKVVAASALNILRELLRKRGQTFDERVTKQFLFEAARACLEGKRTMGPEFKELDPLILAIADQIRKGEISAAEEVFLGGASLPISLPIIKVYNFLKHADRNPMALLSEQAVDAEGAIMLAVSAFSMVFPAEMPSPEMIDYIASYADSVEQYNPHGDDAVW